MTEGKSESEVNVFLDAWDAKAVEREKEYTKARIKAEWELCDEKFGATQMDLWQEARMREPFAKAEAQKHHEQVLDRILRTDEKLLQAQLKIVDALEKIASKLN